MPSPAFVAFQFLYAVVGKGEDRKEINTEARKHQGFTNTSNKTRCHGRARGSFRLHGQRKSYFKEGKSKLNSAFQNCRGLCVCVCFFVLLTMKKEGLKP